ncbi:magnesium transporter MgtE N-terminal domain-containing protein, partial [Eudoraea sp.]|uniref:magnesium transporter MgtE N-terminal domain-containing protein n=1 Tax=Eudoraea sp. TaxID=1979955 RepID=UPI003C75A0C3
MTPKVEITGNVLRNDFFTKYPKDAAQTLESIPQEAILNYLKELPADVARAIFFRLNPDTITSLVLKMDRSLFIGLFSQVDTHMAARILSRLNKDEADKR